MYQVATMRTRAAIRLRAVPLLAILTVIAGQVFYGQVAGNGQPLSLMWPTLCLLSPALWWLFEGNARSSVAATLIMGSLMFGSNHLGGLMPHGYVTAFWFGLPIGTLVAWYVGKPRAAANSQSGAATKSG
jgi:hypothetical protein